ncbi:unnamed protein product [Brassica napus]|uniref:(rape) hypothetical protein n=2 Tax=Brassica TaxID=3705 RepID=A0A816PH22_BRANA|nr:unnamed protein product [Brassica napus]
MENPNKKKFAWLIKNFSSLPSDKLYSAPVLISGFYWDLFTYPKGYKGGDSLVVSLAVTDGQSLPSGWARYVKFRLTIVNHLSHELSIHRETSIWFDQKAPGWGLSGMLPFAKLHDKDGGFLVNDELKIVAELEALEVIGTLDESKDLLDKTSSSVNERIDVNGFQVLPSQVESVRGIFERHPDLAEKFRAKNQHLRTACMNFLLSLSEMLHKSLQELSNEDLVEADVALTYLKNAGFKCNHFTFPTLVLWCIGTYGFTSCVLVRSLCFRLWSLSLMVNKADDNKFTWVIKDFSSLQSFEICSDEFLIGGYKWRLFAYPKGIETDYLSLYLGVETFEYLPLRWRRHAKFSLQVVNPIYEQSPILRGSLLWTSIKMLPLVIVDSKDGGFLVNDELKIVAEVDVLQVTVASDASERSQEAAYYVTGSSDLQKETRVGNETVDVNGFQVSTSQVASVRCIFEKHPDFASKVLSNNQHLKSTYMNVLLGLIETLCQLPEKLSDVDLSEASAAVVYLTQVGFKMDWLEKKLQELKEKKKKMNTGKAQLQHMEEEFKILNKKCLDLKDLLDKQNEDLSAANVAFSFDDVV